MNAHIRAGLSKECFNRLFVWMEALERAIVNLKAASCYFETRTAQIIGSSRTAEAQSDDQTRDLAFVASRALVETSVIFVGHIFTQSRSGHDFAANSDPAVVAIREDMDAYARNQLGWPNAEFEDFYELIRHNRDKLLAHYDGDAANYHEPGPDVAAMRIMGANLDKAEWEKLLEFVTPMHDFLDRKLLPDKPRLS